MYEKIKLIIRNTENINKGINRYQCGESKRKPTIDHMMTLNEIIWYNKYINKETYCRRPLFRTRNGPEVLFELANLPKLKNIKYLGKKIRKQVFLCFIE